MSGQRRQTPGEPSAAEIFAERTAMPRQFRVINEARYELDFPTLGLKFLADRVARERGGELFCNLIVYCNWAGAPTTDGILSEGHFNLTSITTRKQRAAALKQLAPTREIDYLHLLEEFCIKVNRADREGQPSIKLSDMPMPEEDPTLVVGGLTLYPDLPQILFGDGGTGKSLIVLSIASLLQAMGQAVVYADWEMDWKAHRRRLGQLFGARVPDIEYVRPTRPLPVMADYLQRIVEKAGARWLVTDSILFAADGKAEDSDVAGRYFRALGQIGVGSILVAHVNRSDQGDQKPFGSVYWHNGARMTWFVKLGEELRSGISVGLYNRKANLGPKVQPVGYTITFERGTTTIEQIDVAGDPQLAKALSLAQRMRSIVAAGPQTIAYLATELEAQPDSVEKALKRRRDMFTKVLGPDGVTRWGLLSKDRSVA